MGPWPNMAEASLPQFSTRDIWLAASLQHTPIYSQTRHILVVETRQSSEHIKEPYPLGGYAMSTGMVLFKKTQFEGAVSMMYAATMSEKSGQYICLSAIVERGSELARDDDLGERLMNLTWQVAKEKTKPSSSDKGARSSIEFRCMYFSFASQYIVTLGP